MDGISGMFNFLWKPVCKLLGHDICSADKEAKDYFGKDYEGHCRRCGKSFYKTELKP